MNFAFSVNDDNAMNKLWVKILLISCFLGGWTTAVHITGLSSLWFIYFPIKFRQLGHRRRTDKNYSQVRIPGD